jgi:hypothetical protein
MLTKSSAPSLSISFVSLSLLVAPGCSRDEQADKSTPKLQVELLCSGSGCSAFVKGGTPSILQDPLALQDVRRQIPALRRVPDEHLTAREVDGGIIISIKAHK